VLAFDGKVLIADTYNHKIKQLDPETQSVKTLIGTGKPGQADGASPSFYEPGGLTIANSKLYIADTNNHAIRVVDLKAKTSSTLRIKGLEPPLSSAKEAETDFEPNSEEITVPLQRVRAGSSGVLVVQVELPAGHHLNPMAPQRYVVSLEKNQKQLGLTSPSRAGAIDREQELKQTIKNLQLPLRIPFHGYEAGTTTLRAQLTLVYCREDNTGVCRIRTLVWRVPVEVTTDAGAANEIKITRRIADE
jgi:hypothetical protein